MHCIPDVPSHIQDQIERETIITQKALWQAKPVTSADLDKARATSTLFLNVLNKDFDKQPQLNGFHYKRDITIEDISLEDDNLI